MEINAIYGYIQVSHKQERNPTMENLTRTTAMVIIIKTMLHIPI